MSASREREKRARIGREAKRREYVERFLTRAAKPEETLRLPYDGSAYEPQAPEWYRRGR